MKALAALLLIVSAGDYDRIDTPITTRCLLRDIGLSGDEVARHTILLTERGPKEPTPIVARWVGDPASGVGTLAFTMPGRLPKGSSRTYEVTFRPQPPATGPLKAEMKKDAYAQISHGGKPILRYNHGIVRRFPDKADKMDRSSYFHPLWTPSGQEVTADFPADHLHHRGLWFSWVVANQGDVKANFWEFWQGRGKTVGKKLTCVGGPVWAAIGVANECVSGGKTLLEEYITCKVYTRPTDAWLMDLTVYQVPVGGDVVLGKKHYGGLGYRGLDAWNGKQAPIDILTSEGHKGRAGNAKPARWVDYTGKLPNGKWGGVLFIEHPDNPRYPNRLRIHPTMPFLSTTLCASGPYTIKINSGKPLILRYRLVLHDGRPDKALAERLAADFTHPPKAELKRGN